MIPFARIVKYGNVIEPYVPNIVKLVTPSGFTSSCAMLLDKNGLLWAIGVQSGGIFGLGNATTQTEWVQIHSNVKNFWCLSTSGYCLVQTNDDKFFYSGFDGWNGNSATGRVLVFTECTSYFSQIGISNIKEIYPGLNFIVLLGNDDKLYGLGDNSSYALGINTATKLTRFTFLTDNVKKYCSTYSNAHWVIKNDGSLWRTGTTPNGVLGNGIQNTYIFPWVKYVPPTNTGVVDIFCATPYMGFIFNGTSTDPRCPLYTLGGQFGGQLGDGTVANTYKLNPSITIYVSEDSDFIQVPTNNNRGLIYRNGNKIYSAGYNNFGQCANNTNTNVSRFAEAIMPAGVTFDPKTSLVSGSDTILCMFIDNKLYYAGQSPDVKTTSRVMTEFKLPNLQGN